MAKSILMIFCLFTLGNAFSQFQMDFYNQSLDLSHLTKEEYESAVEMKSKLDGYINQFNNENLSDEEAFKVIQGIEINFRDFRGLCDGSRARTNPKFKLDLISLPDEIVLSNFNTIFHGASIVYSDKPEWGNKFVQRLNQISIFDNNKISVHMKREAIDIIEKFFNTPGNKNYNIKQFEGLRDFFQKILSDQNNLSIFAEKNSFLSFYKLAVNSSLNLEEVKLLRQKIFESTKLIEDAKAREIIQRELIAAEIQFMNQAPQLRSVDPDKRIRSLDVLNFDYDLIQAEKWTGEQVGERFLGREVTELENLMDIKEKYYVKGLSSFSIYANEKFLKEDDKQAIRQIVSKKLASMPNSNMAKSVEWLTLIDFRTWHFLLELSESREKKYEQLLRLIINTTFGDLQHYRPHFFHLSSSINRQIELNKLVLFKGNNLDLVFKVLGQVSPEEERELKFIEFIDSLRKKQLESLSKLEKTILADSILKFFDVQKITLLDELGRFKHKFYQDLTTKLNIPHLTTKVNELFWKQHKNLPNLIDERSVFLKNMEQFLTMNNPFKKKFDLTTDGQDEVRFRFYEGVDDYGNDEFSHSRSLGNKKTEDLFRYFEYFSYFESVEEDKVLTFLENKDFSEIVKDVANIADDYRNTQLLKDLNSDALFLYHLKRHSLPLTSQEKAENIESLDKHLKNIISDEKIMSKYFKNSDQMLKYLMKYDPDYELMKEYSNKNINLFMEELIKRSKNKKNLYFDLLNKAKGFIDYGKRDKVRRILTKLRNAINQELSHDQEDYLFFLENEKKVIGNLSPSRYLQIDKLELKNSEGKIDPEVLTHHFEYFLQEKKTLDFSQNFLPYAYTYETILKEMQKEPNLRKIAQNEIIFLEGLYLNNGFSNAIRLLQREAYTFDQSIELIDEFIDINSDNLSIIQSNQELFENRILVTNQLIFDSMINKMSMVKPPLDLTPEQRKQLLEKIHEITDLVPIKNIKEFKVSLSRILGAPAVNEFLSSYNAKWEKIFARMNIDRLFGLPVKHKGLELFLIDCFWPKTN